MAKKLKLSQWHDGSVKPVHVGVYEVEPHSDGTKFFSYFNGTKWNGGWFTINRAYKNRNNTYASIETKWRGVLK